LRLGRSEVLRLVEEGRVEESTSFGPAAAFVYAVESAADASEISARFDGGRILVRVPRDVVRRWAAGDKVDVAATQPIGDGAGSVLSILIEKDFECLDAPASGPQDDAFPNPQRCR
jgi:hypothetical protein